MPWNQCFLLCFASYLVGINDFLVPLAFSWRECHNNRNISFFNYLCNCPNSKLINGFDVLINIKICRDRSNKTKCQEGQDQRPVKRSCITRIASELLTLTIQKCRLTKNRRIWAYSDQNSSFKISFSNSENANFINTNNC